MACCSSMGGTLTMARRKSLRITRGIAAPEMNSDFRYSIVLGQERCCFRNSGTSFSGFGRRIATDDNKTASNGSFTKHVVSSALFPSFAIKTSPTSGWQPCFTSEAKSDSDICLASSRLTPKRVKSFTDAIGFPSGTDGGLLWAPSVILKHSSPSGNAVHSFAIPKLLQLGLDRHIQPYRPTLPSRQGRRSHPCPSSSNSRRYGSKRKRRLRT